MRRASTGLGGLLGLALLLVGCGDEEVSATPGPEQGGGGGAVAPCPLGEFSHPMGGCCPAGTTANQAGGCCDAGTRAMPDGSCQPAGVPPERCGEGFEPDGNLGCEPVLPSAPCPAGSLAVPGETDCHELAPCGAGTWGEIPVEGNTQYVDGGYAEGNSDGSDTRPWTDIQSAIDAAQPDAIVAVAAGSYVGDLLVQNKSVRLWGRCPAMVEIVGVDAELGAVHIGGAADGTELRSLAVTGTGQAAIFLRGSSQVVLDRLWIHDAPIRGVNLEDNGDPTDAVLSDSLVDAVQDYALLVVGAQLTVERTVVRNTFGIPPDYLGSALGALASRETANRAEVTVRNSIIDANEGHGAIIYGASATIESTVISRTHPHAPDGSSRGVLLGNHSDLLEVGDVTLRGSVLEHNEGNAVFSTGARLTLDGVVVRDTLPIPPDEDTTGVLLVGDDDLDPTGHMTIRDSLLDRNHGVALCTAGAAVTLEGTVVRDTQPESEQSYGWGVFVTDQWTTGARGDLTVRGSLLDGSHEAGIEVLGANISIHGTVVRNTLPSETTPRARAIEINGEPDWVARATLTIGGSKLDHNHGLGMLLGGSDAVIHSTLVQDTLVGAEGTGGRALSIQWDRDTGGANVTLRSSVIDGSHDTGVFVLGSHLLVENTIVRNTQPTATGHGGRGIIARPSNWHDPARVSLRGSLLEANHEVGLFVDGAEVVAVSTTIRDSRPSQATGLFGDGVLVVSNMNEPASATFHGCQIDSSARAGVASFGATVTLSQTTLDCNTVQLNGERDYGLYGPPLSFPFSFEDRGGNECGCDGHPAPCAVLSTGLAPPAQLPEPEQPAPHEQPVP